MTQITWRLIALCIMKRKRKFDLKNNSWESSPIFTYFLVMVTLDGELVAIVILYDRLIRIYSKCCVIFGRVFPSGFSSNKLSTFERPMWAKKNARIFNGAEFFFLHVDSNYMLFIPISATCLNVVYDFSSEPQPIMAQLNSTHEKKCA